MITLFLIFLTKEFRELIPLVTVGFSIIFRRAVFTICFSRLVLVLLFLLLLLVRLFFLFSEVLWKLQPLVVFFFDGTAKLKL